MKSNLQFGYNEQTKKYVISSPGEGQVSLSIDEIDNFVNYAAEHSENELPKGEQNDSNATEH